MLSTPAMWFLAVVASALGMGEVRAEPEAAQTSVHGCVRLVRAESAGSMAARWRTLPASERRARLILTLRRDLAQVSRPVVAVLREYDSRDLQVLWGPGVVCAWAPESAWQRVAKLPGVEAFFEDPPRSPAEIDDGTGPNSSVPPESPLVSMRVPEVWERGLTGEGVLVALIDTGVDMTHPDLTGQIWVNPGEIPGNGLDDDGNGFIDDAHGWDFASSDNDPSDSAGHGTRAAGLLAGNGTSGMQTGTAPDLTLMVIRRGTTQAKLWECSQYAVENGARIISQSTSWKWSFTTDYASWRRQADVELAAGVIHTNSSGNTGQQQETEPIPYNVAAPALCPPPWHHPGQVPANGLSSVLGVGNVDSRSLEIVATSPYGPSEWTDISAHRDPEFPFEMPAEYQDYPTWEGSPGLDKPDLVAPGEGSVSTERNGGYTTFGGTSAATPRVAGVLALMLQAVPAATPADLAASLLGTCRDLGPAGRDLRFGAGMPDAAAAVDDLGPPLRIVSVELIDPGAPRGDGDGGADEGEIDRLRIELENTGGQDVADIELLIRGRAHGQPRDGWATIPLILAGGRGETPAPYLSVEFSTGSCSQVAEIELEIRQGGRSRIETLFLGVGTETRTTLIETDFESAAGFTTDGDASSGGWVREQPVGTSSGGRSANPSEDHTADPGLVAWVTGNGPTDPDAADVDLGATRLSSPVFDGSGYDEVELVYHRWFFGSDPLGEDRTLVEATGDGSNWSLLEEVTASDNTWRRRRIVLSDLLTPTSTMTVRFSVEDAGGGAGDDTVEGGLDDFSVTGIALDCLPWSIPPGDPPDPVGPTLRLQPLAGAHVELTWDPPSAAGGSDPNLGYRVTRSPDPGAGFAQIGQPTQNRHVDVDAWGGAAGEVSYYLVDSIE